jgi:hypothetical protein
LTVSSVQLASVLRDALLGEGDVLLGKFSVECDQFGILKRPLKSLCITCFRSRLSCEGEEHPENCPDVGSLDVASLRLVGREVAQFSKGVKIGLLLVRQNAVVRDVTTKLHERSTSNLETAAPAGLSGEELGDSPRMDEQMDLAGASVMPLNERLD